MTVQERARREPGFRPPILSRRDPDAQRTADIAEIYCADMTRHGTVERRLIPETGGAFLHRQHTRRGPAYA